MAPAQVFPAVLNVRVAYILTLFQMPFNESRSEIIYSYSTACSFKKYNSSGSFSFANQGRERPLLTLLNGCYGHVEYQHERLVTGKKLRSP
jgi:hypothetical protein